MLSDARRDELTRFAREILENLDAYRAVGGLPPVDFRELTKKGTSRGPNDVIESLLRCALELQTGAPVQIGFIWSPTSAPIIHPSHPKPASWLMGAATPGAFAYVLLDRGRILSTVPTNMPRMINQLCLHEIGHVFLHWNSLFGGAPRVMAPLASSVQEAEAWCFCFAIVMLVAEQLAEDFRNAPVGQRAHAVHVWELIRDLRI